MTRRDWLALAAIIVAAVLAWWFVPQWLVLQMRDCEHAGALRSLVCGDQP